MKIKNNENLKDCAACGGSCCKALPGSFWPSDFEDIEKEVLDGLVRGDFSIDWYESDPRANVFELDCCYYVRMRVKDCDKVYDPSWGGECKFLTVKGCALPFEKRAHDCKALIPKFDYKEKRSKCTGETEKRETALKWVKYQGMLDRIGDLAKNKIKSNKWISKRDEMHEIRRSINPWSTALRGSAIFYRFGASRALNDF